jgi:hypothetical protein
LFGFDSVLPDFIMGVGRLIIVVLAIVSDVHLPSGNGTVEKIHMSGEYLRNTIHPTTPQNPWCIINCRLFKLADPLNVYDCKFIDLLQTLP